MEPTRPTVLIVEDEILVRESLASHLDDAGFQVLQAEDGEHASSLLRTAQDRIDWLFTDIRLPGGIDGWRLAEEFRRAHPFRPVVYATAFREEWPQQVPGSIFLRKPYLPAQVVAAFRRLTHDMDAIAPH
jgi:two-component system, OmpR family, response regulator